MSILVRIYALLAIAAAAVSLFWPRESNPVHACVMSLFLANPFLFVAAPIAGFLLCHMVSNALSEERYSFGRVGFGYLFDRTVPPAGVAISILLTTSIFFMFSNLTVIQPIIRAASNP